MPLKATCFYGSLPTPFLTFQEDETFVAQFRVNDALIGETPALLSPAVAQL